MSSSGSYRGNCVFCEKPIPPSDPPEHVMPKWLHQFRPKGMRFDHKPGFEVRGDTIKRIGEESMLARQPETTTDVVCKACNGEWMSDLETQASQLLPSMIEGGTSLLLVIDQAAIAAWTAKTVMTWQTVNPSSLIIPISEYHWFYANKIPLPLTKIFLGCYIGNDLPFMGYSQEELFSEKISEPTPTKPAIAATGYRSILTIGHLIFEIVGVGHPSSDDSPPEAQFPLLVGDALVEIWPSTGDRYWPPRALGDEEIMRFLDIPPGIAI